MAHSGRQQPAPARYGSVEEGRPRLDSEASLVVSADEAIDGRGSSFASRYERTNGLSLVSQPLIVVPIAPILTTGSVSVEKWFGNADL